jgi:hypothetical protein
MRLRSAGTCRTCAAQVPAGQQSLYLPVHKQVECLSCAEMAAAPETSTPMVEPSMVDAGTAAASARREFDRRAAKREQQIRTAHPKLGG